MSDYMFFCWLHRQCEVMGNIANPVLKIDFLFSLISWHRCDLGASGRKERSGCFFILAQSQGGDEEHSQCSFPVQGQIFQGTWSDIP